MVEPTGADKANENGLEERPNQTIAAMVIRLLYAAGLPLTYWTDAYLYVVYLYNRMVHSGIGMTPYQAQYGVKPNLSRLCVFDSRVNCKIPGQRRAKLDKHTYDGIFLGYGSTDKHIRYMDVNTLREKLTTHATFDEAHYTSEHKPPGPQLLYNLGIYSPSAPHDNPSKDVPSYPTILPVIPPSITSMHTHKPLPIQETASTRLTMSGPTNVYHNHNHVTNACTMEFSLNQFRHANA